MADIRKNFGYNIILNISTYVASLITFPYVSRVLGAESIGIVTYVNQFVQYFILFSMLGVVGIGTREIAGCGNDEKKRSETFSSLLGISTAFTVIVLFVYGLCICFIPTFIEYKKLFLIGSAQILFTTFQIEWFYRGIEDFRYITIRNIAIRVLYIVLLFILVKNESDYIIYFILSTGVVVINAIINLLYSRKFITFRLTKESLQNTWKPFSKQFAILGANNIMNSFYSSFNVVYLGLVCAKTEVGYYSVSNKIMTICLGVITAFSLVMLPRMSSLAGEKDREQFNNLLNKSFAVIIDACIPLCIMLICYAPYIVLILSGNGFERAILPLRIIAPVIVINALAQIVVWQVEMPLHKDKAILTASIIGAVVGLALNFALVKQKGVVGSAIVLCCSVLASFIYNLWYCINNKLMSFPTDKLLSVILKSLPYVLLWIVLEMFIGNKWVIFGVGSSVSLLYWVILNKDIFMGFVKSYFKR